MDWTQAFTIIGVFFAGFVYIMNRMDKKFDDIQAELRRIDSKVSNIEGQITQMTRPNIVHFDRPHKDDRNGAKEN